MWSKWIYVKGMEDKVGREVDFVKAHAGWDEIIFLYGEQLPDGKELEVGLSLLRRPSLRGTEVGILYQPEKSGDIRVKILDATSSDFVAMCGGLTQCLGKAVVETDIGARFNIKVTEPETEFVLETEAGPIPIRVEVSRGIARQVMTNMRSYVEKLYKCGVRAVRIEGISAVNVGVDPSRTGFLVLNTDVLKKEYPDVNFWEKREPALNVLKELYEGFIEQEDLGGSFLYGALYDMHPERDGDARIIFRFLPTMYYQAIGYEEACGTGTIAVGIAMLNNGDIEIQNGKIEMLFEVGSASIVNKSEQITTALRMITKEGKVIDAEFSHNLIEIIAYGKVHI